MIWCYILAPGVYILILFYSSHRNNSMDLTGLVNTVLKTRCIWIILPLSSVRYDKRVTLICALQFLPSIYMSMLFLAISRIEAVYFVLESQKYLLIVFNDLVDSSSRITGQSWLYCYGCTISKQRRWRFNSVSRTLFIVSILANAIPPQTHRHTKSNTSSWICW